MIKLAAAMTSYNRSAKTVRCLRLLEISARVAGVSLSAMLVDDNSTDDTVNVVKAEFPWVVVKQGSGSLFWSRGMHLAMVSIDLLQVDYVLWLNDDTELAPDALARLLATAAAVATTEVRTCIIVGATADPHNHTVSYSGMVRSSRLRPLSFRKIYSQTEVLKCEAMNGNVVLVPKEVCLALGPIDPTFEHAMGDIDYGLRATNSGHEVYLAPGTVGICANNSLIGTSADSTLPLKERWEKLVGRKGVPPRSWLHLVRRHAGPLWPLYFIWPYGRFFVAAGLDWARSLANSAGSDAH